MLTNGIGKISVAAAARREAVVVVAAVRKRSFAMADGEDHKVYLHYNHTDPCKHRRWTTRECYEYMYERPWERVVEFYSDLVRGNSSLSSLFAAENPQFHDVTENPGESEGPDSVLVPSEDRSGRWARLTFKIVLSYHGGSFDGWQKQPGLNTVQGLVENSLGGFVDENKTQQLKEKCLPIEGCATVAGRTDKGVTALRQVCSFYTWRKDVKCRDIEVAINYAAPGKLRALSVSEVSRVFHPNFSAKWRRYFYIFPLSDGEEEVISGEERFCSINFNGLNNEQKNWDKTEEDNVSSLTVCDADDSVFNTSTKQRCFSISKVNHLLRQLEGKSLSYRMFARDTKASRSTGPPTECYVFHARAAEAIVPSTNKTCIGGLRLMCVELVANRFLRRMVRVLVATAIREAAAGASNDALLKLIDATCRRATAPPAPPDGLCLADVGYGDFKQENCLIL